MQWRRERVQGGRYGRGLNFQSDVARNHPMAIIMQCVPETSERIWIAVREARR